jgi:flavin reductase (DIM6/NTAB) family NADH-FMN oxidoreductase RutF
MWRSYLSPRPICIVTTVEPGGRANAITLGWSMPTSFQPPLLAVSVAHTRYSHLLLERGREFVLNVPSAEQRDLAFDIGGCSGRDVDKFEQFEMTAVPARQVAPPVIGDCLAAVECRIVDQISTGDHTIFIGEAIEAYPLGEEFEARRVLVQGL